MSTTSKARSRNKIKRSFLRTVELLCFYILLPGILAVSGFNMLFNNKYPLETTVNLKSYSSETAAVDSIEAYERPESSLNFITRDYRAVVLDRYFYKYDSPLFGYGEQFVKMCDKYSLPSDCTLIPAIAYVETKLCTKALSAVQNNCWGWGGSGSNRIVFKNFNEAIETISRSMHDGYGAILKRPDRIAVTYCGGACTDWGGNVLSQQKAINNLAKQMGLPALLK